MADFLAPKRFDCHFSTEFFEKFDVIALSDAKSQINLTHYSIDTNFNYIFISHTSHRCD